ncbi:MAG: DUF456 domain-containing protein [Alistipes sp.]|nr:DUF456 domain-containing protein [Alistipes sp.]
MDVLLSILAILFILIGIVGCVLPILPGQFLAYVGFVCCYFCSYAQIPTRLLWIYLALIVVVSILDFILPAYFTKLSGGSKAGERGATAGLIVGMLLGSIVGAIVGPFFGAIAGELLKDSSDVGRAVKSGFGSFLSFIVGTGMKLFLSMLMLFKVCGEVFPAIGNWFSNIF